MENPAQHRTGRGQRGTPRRATSNALKPPLNASPAGLARSWWPRLLGAACALLLRLWSATWRKRIIGREHLDRLTGQRERTLVLFWHGHYLPLFALLRDCRGCALTNRSFRGQVIAEICRRFGYHTLQLPEETGRRFLVTLRQAMADHPLWGTAADGPLGPAHQVKGPTMKLAAHFGFTLLPVAVAARRAWRRQKRWDRMALPAFGTRVALVIGPPLKLPAALTDRDALRWARRAEAAIRDCAAQALDITGPSSQTSGTTPGSPPPARQ